MGTDTSIARVTVRQKGVVIPIVEHVVHRSPDLASRGLLIEHHAIGKREYPKREPQSHIVYMHIGASVPADIEGPGFSGRTWLRPGVVWIMPQGSEHAVRFNGDVEGLGVSFTPDRFDQLLASAGVGLGYQLEERIVVAQPKLEHLMRALWHESAQPNEPGLLTAERAKRLLHLKELAIAEVGAMVGFAHESHFALAFRTFTVSLRANLLEVPEKYQETSKGSNYWSLQPTLKVISAVYVAEVADGDLVVESQTAALVGRRPFIAQAA